MGYGNGSGLIGNAPASGLVAQGQAPLRSIYLNDDSQYFPRGPQSNPGGRGGNAADGTTNFSGAITNNGSLVQSANPNESGRVVLNPSQNGVPRLAQATRR